MTFVLTILFLIGGAQGIFMTIALVTRKDNSLANRILSLLLFIFALNLLSRSLIGFGLYKQFPHLLWTDSSVTLLYGPLIYQCH